MNNKTLLMIAALMVTTTAQAADTKPDPGVVSPDAQYSYAQASDCMSSIFALKNVSPKSGEIAMAMLGRLPVCEVEKIILASKGHERVKKLINHRKSKSQ